MKLFYSEYEARKLGYVTEFKQEVFSRVDKLPNIPGITLTRYTCAVHIENRYIRHDIVFGRQRLRFYINDKFTEQVLSILLSAYKKGRINEKNRTIYWNKLY